MVLLAGENGVGTLLQIVVSLGATSDVRSLRVGIIDDARRRRKAVCSYPSCLRSVRR